jgi:hypothetical protein
MSYTNSTVQFTLAIGLYTIQSRKNTEKLAKNQTNVLILLTSREYASDAVVKY